MIDATFVVMILAFIGLIFTILWSDRRHDKRQDALEGALAEMRTDFAGVKDEVAGVQVELAGVKAAVQANSERLDRMDERFDRQDERFDRQEQRFDERFNRQEQQFNERFDHQEQRFDERFAEMQQSIRIVSSKVDRAQGNLDVLVYGDRGVPAPVQRERDALEARVEEPVGD